MDLVGHPDHIFNTDLLLRNDDIEFARSKFPDIFHVLDHPELRMAFLRYDLIANRSRDRVRISGLTAIAASVIALIALVTRSQWPVTPWTPWLAGTLELGGLVAAIVLMGGIWLGSPKRRWLESRLMTERLRQWHFQSMICAGREIEASYRCGPEAIQEFRNKRKLALTEFLTRAQPELDNRLQAVVEDPVQSFAWLHEHVTPFSTDNYAFSDISDAYEILRFDKQYGYALAKLKTTTSEPLWRFLKWPLLLQRALISGASSACFAAALVCSAILIVGYETGLDETWEIRVRTLAISVTVVGVALRAVFDGLGLDSEVDRYREYRGKIALLWDRFKRTPDPAQRLSLMMEFEYTSVEEMRDFLRTQLKAKFSFA